MTVGAYCRNCGRIVFATSEKIGSPIICPGCGATLQVTASLSRDEPVNLACPRCASVLRVIRELEGHRIRCTTCRLALRVSASPWKLTPIDEAAQPIEEKSDEGHEDWQSRVAAAAAQQVATAGRLGEESKSGRSSKTPK